MGRFLRAAFSAAVMNLAAVASASATTYFYGGFIDPTNSRDGGAKPYVALDAPLTFTFTTANPLPANSNIFNGAALVLTWEASGGSPGSTITQADPHAALPNFHIITNAAGDIVTFFIGAKATDPDRGGPPGITPWFLFSNYGGNNSDTIRFLENAHDQNTGGVNCTLGGCSRSRTSFVRLAESPPSPPGVPEPATWALMAIGFGGVGALLRRRLRPVVA